MSGSEKLNNIPTYLHTQKNLSRRMANKFFFNLGLMREMSTITYLVSCEPTHCNGVS
jgi:hypothetical protein